MPFVETLETLWPPMEEGSGADEGWLRLECDALLGLRLLQILDAGEMTVDQPSNGHLSI